jgi:hypothetical protein
MKHALVDGQLTPATSDAPVMATCPACGGQVKLRSRQGTFFWRHVELPLSGCQPVNTGSAVAGDESKHWTRRVGDFVIELHLDESEGYRLELRSLSEEEGGEDW